MVDDGRIGFWTRVVADESFRLAVIDDPLRAIADTPDVAVSSEQVRRLEELTREERDELVTHVMRDVHFKGGTARFGGIGPDGRLGGG